MGAKPSQNKASRAVQSAVTVDEAVNQHQVRPHMAIPIVLPVACEWVIAVFRLELHIVCQGCDDLLQVLVDMISTII
jgi:hypothetical protein